MTILQIFRRWRSRSGWVDKSMGMAEKAFIAGYLAGLRKGKRGIAE